MTFTYNDGGRSSAGYRGKAGDCVTRAIAIAAEQDYETVYRELKTRNEVFALASGSRSRVAKTLRGKKSRSPRDGMFKEVYKPYLESLGWEWVPTMRIGQGCTVHLRTDELPGGRVICKVSRHLVAVIDGVIHDTFDCSRDGQRCVYGYFREVA
jgi:hypothetical protein